MPKYCYFAAFREQKGLFSGGAFGFIILNTDKCGTEAAKEALSTITRDFNLKREVVLTSFNEIPSE